MTALAQIGKEEARLIRDEMGKAVDEVLARYGMERKKSFVSYGATSATVKFDVNLIGQSREAESYKRDASLVGLPYDGLGKVLTLDGKEFTITGLNLRASKYPVNAVASHDGKTYRLTIASVQKALGL